MAFKIDYLAEAGVVHVKTPTSTSLAGAAAEARSGGATAKTLFGARSFQVRDLSDGDKVVLTEPLVPIE